MPLMECGEAILSTLMLFAFATFAVSGPMQMISPILDLIPNLIKEVTVEPLVKVVKSIG